MLIQLPFQCSPASSARRIRENRVGVWVIHSLR